ncbi:MAG: sodium:solute symporter [Candidatus Sumerlaeia bacterium]|nr:sodium:solute symporter [Candidatus Sumerlaeia bacterium]
MDHGWLSVLPPVLAIALAIATRQVVLSLLAGVWSGWIIAASGNPLKGTADAIACLVNVFGEAWQTRVILFTMLMGSLLILMQRSGGVDGFVAWVGRWKWAHTRRGAQLMAWIVGLGVFIESTITCLVVGTVSRPLFDRLRISREKLAYICDSTSAPVCILLPFNGWGATVLALLATQAAAGHLGDQGPLTVFVAAIPLNFYAILSVLLVLLTILTGWEIGPMRAAERRARVEGKVLRDGAMPVVDAEVISIPAKEGVPPRLRNLLLPLIAMVAMVPVGILITGWPGLAGVPAGAGFPAKFMALLNEASGSLAVLWAVLFALALAAVAMWAQRIFRVQEIVDLSFKGAGGLVPLATIMMLAFAIGMTCNALGTGNWVAEMAQPHLSPGAIAPVVFVVSCFIAFSTGTSWGTFAIMMPLAVPLAASYAAHGDPVSIPLVVSAVLGGGVFGDHCSPISDTTVVSSMASCSDHIDHVRTQMPYALIAASLTLAIYITLGAL